jgi:glycosyltransferase involved in cell wall biosynthesis
MLVRRMIQNAPPGIEYHVVVLDLVGEWGEELRASGVEVLRTGRRPGVDLGLVRRLGDIYREMQPELIHCHQYTPWFYGGWAAGLSGLPCIFTEHGRHQPDRVRLRRVVFNRYLLRHTPVVTAVSHSIQQALARYEKIPASRIELLYNGVDHLHLRADADLRSRMREQLGLAPSTLAIGHAGRFMPVKNQAMLLRALAELSRTHPNLEWKAFLAGWGPLEDELRRQSDELGLSGRVVFLGERKDVPDLLNAFDVFALSSWSEGTSVTLLESMATGLPAVATAVGGNPELIEDGVSGRLVPSDDAAAFAAALGDLSDASLRTAMGRHARELLEERFTEQRMIERFASIYAEVLGA